MGRLVDSLEVDIPATEPLVITANTTPVSCHDESDAVITITGTTEGVVCTSIRFHQTRLHNVHNL